MLDVAATNFGWNPQAPGQERQTEFRAQEPWTTKYRLESRAFLNEVLANASECTASQQL